MLAFRLSAVLTLAVAVLSCSDDKPEPEPEPEPVFYGFAVNLTGDGTGLIRSLNEVVNCSDSCTYEIEEGTVLELVAEPARGSEFTGWSGACAGLQTSCNVTMNANRTVSAQFSLEVEPELDTDGDGLTDAEELLLGTSPYLVDTDGDGYSDYEEVRELGFDPTNNPYKFNPNIADVPKIKINQISPPAITLDMRSSVTSATTVSAGTSRETSTAVTTSESTTNSLSIERTLSIARKSEGLLSIQLPTETKRSYQESTTEENAFTWSTAQTQENRLAFNESTAITQEEGFEYLGGRLSVLVRVQNNGHIAFTLSNLVLGAVEIVGTGGQFARPIGNLSLDSTYANFPVTTLGPGEIRDSLIFERTNLNLSTTLDLLRDSRGLLLTATSYELTDASGVAFNHSLTQVRARTATVIVDYGPASGRAPEYHMVATNLDPSNPGITLGTAMQRYLYMPYEAEGGLKSVRNVAEDLDNRKEWTVAHFYTDAGTEKSDVFTSESEAYDFDGIRLRAGDIVHLIYMDDGDDDGLGARDEFMYGTNPNLPDTDGDGLKDGDEVFGVQIAGVTLNDARVFTNPLMSDTDGDGVTDGAEVAAGTDPTSSFPYIYTGGDRHAAAHAVVTDIYGNAYVVGYGTRIHTGGPNGKDWWVAKFSRRGEIMWQKTFDGGFDDGPGQGNGGMAHAAAISPDGYLVVAGYHSLAYNIAAQEYWWAKKLSLVDGAEHPNWNMTFYRDVNGASDQALAVAVDSQSNVYIGGYMARVASLGSRDWVVRKFSPTGTQLADWPIDHNNGADAVTALVVDNTNSVYVGGYSTNIAGPTSGRDWRIIKYNSAGTVVWDIHLDGGRNGGDTLQALAVDGQLNVYAAGYGSDYVGQGSGFDWLIKKFRADGTEITAGWNKTVNGQIGTDIPYAMTIANNALYVVGSYSPQFDTDGHVRKYALDGTEDIAAQGLNFFGSSSVPRVPNRFDALRGIAVGRNGQFFVVGYLDEEESQTTTSDSNLWVSTFYDWMSL